MAYEGGFQQGLAQKIDIPSMKNQLMFYHQGLQAEKIANQKIKAEREAAAKKGREDFVAKNRELRKESLNMEFDNTGITDLDGVFGDKLSKTLYDSLSQNEWSFLNGFTTREQYDQHAANLEAGIASVKDVYKKIAALPNQITDLEAKGQDSIMNQFNLQHLDWTSKNAVPMMTDSGDPYLRYLSDDGQLISSEMSMLGNYATPQVGAGDMDELVKDIVEAKGASEYLRRDKTGKIKDYTLGKGRDVKHISRQVSSQVKEFNGGQLVDAAFKLGLVEQDEELAKENGVDLINAKNVYNLLADPKYVDKLRGQVQDALVGKIQDDLAWKQSSVAYQPTKPSGSGPSWVDRGDGYHIMKTGTAKRYGDLSGSLIDLETDSPDADNTQIDSTGTVSVRAARYYEEDRNLPINERRLLVEYEQPILPNAYDGMSQEEKQSIINTAQVVTKDGQTVFILADGTEIRDVQRRRILMDGNNVEQRPAALEIATIFGLREVKKKNGLE